MSTPYSLYTLLVLLSQIEEKHNNQQDCCDMSVIFLYWIPQNKQTHSKMKLVARNMIVHFLANEKNGISGPCLKHIHFFM